MFPAWMRSFSHVREDRFRSLGKNVFGKEDGLIATEEFLASVGMKLRLRDLGCKWEYAELIANLVIALANTPSEIGTLFEPGQNDSISLDEYNTLFCGQSSLHVTSPCL